MREIKCEAYKCDENAWGSVPTAFGEGWLCMKHLDMYQAAQKKKWQAELEIAFAPKKEIKNSPSHE